MGKSKHTLEYIKKEFEKNNCTLISTEYINNQTKLKYKYKCKCGNESNITYNNFQKGARCMKCSSKTEKLTFEFVQKYFTKNKCKLLETEYIMLKLK